MKIKRLNPPSYDLLVVLRATLAKLEARRKPLSSKQEILRGALVQRILSIEEILRSASLGQKKPVNCEPESSEVLRRA